MPAIDRYPTSSGSASGPAVRLASLEPSDTAELDYVTSGLLVGSAGSIVILASEDSVPVSLTVQAGAILPVRARKVMATGTTATGIVALIS